MNSHLKHLQDNFTLPYTPHDYQIEGFDESVGKNAVLLRHKVGLGKSLISLMISLSYTLNDGVEQIIVLCPPILIDQADELFGAVPEIPSVLVYRGTPAERKALDLENSSIVIMSYNIFRGKRDYPRIKKLFDKRKICIVADELSCKSLKSQTYRKIKQTMYRKLRVNLNSPAYHKLIALNATPLSDPAHVYIWSSLFTPGVYGSKRLFDSAHILKEDHWGHVTEWKNEEIMQRNMELFTVDTHKTIKLPPIVTTEIPYTLSKKHHILYKEVEMSELENLPEDKIELAVNSMFSTLQRLAIMPSEFGLDIRPPILDYLDSYLDQVGDEGVVMFTRHKAISKMLQENIPDCVAIYGGTPKKIKTQALADVKSGKLKRIVANMDSAGFGLNWHMLNHAIYIELPFRDDKLTQTTGRIHRQGQKDPCFINIPIAKGTIQRQIYRNLLKNGEVLGHILKDRESVKKFLTS